jgi:two-component system phosphate regulon sensor histidine kinase PhoR
MNVSPGRLAAALLTLVAGAAVGALLGRVVLGAHAGWAAALGVLAVALLLAAADALRARRLLAWLRGSQSASAPREGPLWGELAYRIEKALRERDREIATERERLQQFLRAIDASPNGVMLLDASDRIEWCNARAADHFGLDPERDRHQIVTNLLRAPAFVAYLQGNAFEQAIEIAGPRARTQVSVLIRPYGQGQKLLLSQDVTERDRMDAMRRDFVANVSHEIRTPLTVLAGFVETLATVPLSAAEQPRVLTLMRQQTARIQSLVDDLLTLAQLEGSPRPPADRWLAADALIERATADLQIAGSDGELASAMDNLLNNAVRYTPDGGRIELRWSLREADGSALFEVEDNGPGIARDHLPRLAERFYRVDSSRSRETGGTGLGLAIVKHVVQRHGGELEIDSEPGRGSTFRLVLPASRVRAVVNPRVAAPA